jgi:hypothetical protein
MNVSVLCLMLVCAVAVSRASAAESVAPTTGATCGQDSDCKLIYSSCGCEAVPVSDARERLDSDRGVDCHHNVCRSQHARAVCSSGVCTREPATWDASPRKP